MNSQKECLGKNGWLRKREDKCKMRELLTDSKLWNVRITYYNKDSKLKSFNGIILVCPPDFANVQEKIRLGDTGVPQNFGPRHNTAKVKVIFQGQL